MITFATLNAKMAGEQFAQQFFAGRSAARQKGATKLRSFSAIAKHAENIFAAGELIKPRLSAENPF